jgi:glycosyltransferase involved in cell wall biosynthesis
MARGEAIRRPGEPPALRLALVSQGSPVDPEAWSGTPYFLLRELRRRFGEISVIDTPRIDALVARATAFSALGILPSREPLMVDWFGRHLQRRLRRIRPDAVVAVAAEGKVASLATTWPMLVVSDSFFGNMIDYYDKYAALNPRTRRNGEAQQRALLDSGAGVLLSSEWAATTAAAHYGAPRSRFRVAPFGANLDVDPGRRPPRSNAGPMRLLFVGYDWSRKGGDLVLAILRGLRARLPDVELDIIGCRPPVAVGAPGVTCHGVLRKRVPEEAERLAAFYRGASFLLMPSRQEAFGLVLAEACAFGLPSVVADTGGVGAIVEAGVNGLMAPLEAGADVYVRAILDLWSREADYLAMQAAARDAFETRLNWRAWGDVAEAVLGGLVAPRGRNLASLTMADAPA